MNRKTPANDDKPLTALVLSSGGGRGAFECGVIETFEELAKGDPKTKDKIGWPPDILAGTSIGATNAAVYACRGVRDPEQDGAPPGLNDLWDELRDGKRKMHRLRWPWSWKGNGGMYDREPWRKALEDYAPDYAPGKDLKGVDKSLYVVTTDIVRGCPMIYYTGEDPKPGHFGDSRGTYQKGVNHVHILASSAIPYAYPTIGHGGIFHWDGALVYSSPLQPAIDAQAKRILVVLLAPFDAEARLADQGSPIPKKIGGKIGHLLDLTTSATFENDYAQMVKNNTPVQCLVIEPPRWLKVLHILTYKKEQIDTLRKWGESAAKEAWKKFAGGQDGWTYNGLKGTG
jgi:NTE family protein